MRRIGTGGDLQISNDGRFVAFVGMLGNWGPVPHDDQYETVHRWLRDRRTGTTVEMSAGLHSGAETFDLSMSGDGRYVAWTHSREIAGPGNFPMVHMHEIMLFDRITGTLDCLTCALPEPCGTVPSESYFGSPKLSYDGSPTAISDDARYVVVRGLASGLSCQVGLNPCATGGG